MTRLQIGEAYDTTCATLWKDGTYAPRGTRVTVVGMHVDQGFCVRFPGEGSEPLETWEGWSESGFLAAPGSIEPSGHPLSGTVLNEAREILSDAEDGCHVHLHEDD